MILEPPIWATNSWVADVWADGTWGIIIVPPHGEGGISVELPDGWLNFSGGGSDPDLCGESGEVGEPGTIPTGAINALPEEFDCEDAENGLEVELTFSGGVPPVTWETTQGQLTVTGPRTATLAIDLAVNLFFTGAAGDTEGCEIPAFTKRARRLTPSDNGADPPIFACEGGLSTWECYSAVFDCVGKPFQGGALTSEEFINAEPCEDEYNAIVNNFQAAQYSEYVDGTLCAHLDSGWPLTCLITPVPGNNTAAAAQCGINACDTAPSSPVVFERDGCPDFTVSGSTGSRSVAFNVLLGDAGQVCDLRTDASKAIGCSPCEIIQNTDIIVTVTDARGVSTAIEVHVG